MNDAVQPTAPAARSNLKVIAVGFALLLLLASGAVVTLVLMLDDLARDRIVAEAKKRGLDVSVGSVDVSLGSIRLGDLRVSAIGVEGLSTQVDSLSVLLDGFQPQKLDAEGVRVQAVGEPLKLANQLLAWREKYGRPVQRELPTLSLTASQLSVSYAAAPDGATQLSLQGGALRYAASGTRLDAATASVFGISLRELGVVLDSTQLTVAANLGTDGRDVPVRAEVSRSTAPATAKLTLFPATAGALSRWLGTELPVADTVRISGKTELQSDGGWFTGVVSGNITGVLDGYTPPHPHELGGFDFGRRTTLDVRFSSDESRRGWRLEPLHVRAGGFQLAGGGLATVHGSNLQDGYVTANLRLTGNLLCSAVAKSAATAHVGSALGDLFGGVASHFIKGSVSVSLGIDADSRNLGGAAISQSIGVGCGLRPLALPKGFPTTLGELKGERDKLPEELRQVPEALKNLPKPPELPDLPDLPKLPKLSIKLPTLRLPSFDRDKEEPEPSKKQLAPSASASTTSP